MEYIPTIGLEIHVELKTNTGLFCKCKNDPTETHPNVNICPVCTGQPGALPTINKEAVEKLITAGLALNCTIAEFSKFDRKNYFYPDLPKGYQISQYDMPLCSGGYITIKNGRSIHLERIHLEEDAGKLSHTKEGETLVDYNRAGVPLMELVTKPEIESAEEVEQFARELQLILRYVGASEANIERGQMRVEVNLSIRPKSQKLKANSSLLGTKVEIKNIGSINAAMRAAKHEYARQVALLKAGEEVKQETRGWDDEEDTSHAQRTKEGSADYRYFPEPDLPPMRFDQDYIERLKNDLPELPSQRRERFRRQYGLNESQIEIFTTAKPLGDYFEQVISELDSWENIKSEKRPDAERAYELHALAANYIITEFPPLFKLSPSELGEVEGITIAPPHFADLMVRIFHNELSSTSAKIVLKAMAETGEEPELIIKEKDLAQVSDTDELEKIVADVLSQNQDAVEKYKSGKVEIIGFLVGKVMAASRGKANPQIANELIKKVLNK